MGYDRRAEVIRFGQRHAGKTVIVGMERGGATFLSRIESPPGRLINGLPEPERSGRPGFQGAAGAKVEYIIALRGRA